LAGGRGWLFACNSEGAAADVVAVVADVASGTVIAERDRLGADAADA
jgi:hypothetical protein